MKTGKKPILWSLLALIVTMLMFVPILNFFALLVILVPYTVLYTLLDRKSLIVHTLVILAIGSIVVGPVGFIGISLLSIVPSMFLSKYYKQGMPSIKIVPRLTALFALVMMIGLFVLDKGLNFSFITDISSIMTATFNDMASQGLVGANWSADTIERFIDMMMKMIPLVFFIMSLIIVACSHTIARRIISANGVQVIAYPAAKDWRLPRKIVAIYFIAYIIELMMDPTADTFMTLVVLNLVPALSLMFTIQAIGFFYFLADQYRWPKFVPFIIAIPVLFFPLSSVLGLIDVAFPLRSKISKKP